LALLYQQPEGCGKQKKAVGGQWGWKIAATDVSE
jgi:hypothetical protein